MVRIAEIESGGIADELELQIGTRIVRINGERVRDGIDLAFMLADPDLELEAVTPSGERVVYEIEREPGQPLGIVPAPDTIRECANECVFCFIDGNPPGVRESLWLRDDDFRLSFTYGSYVTLTNLGPRGFARLIEQRISPLYVSVHATEPDVRVRLLKNRTAGAIMDQLRSLTSAGLEVHTQVVLCPEWNDGNHLDRTIDDLWSLGGGVLSLSVVPVGLTRYNDGRPVRPLRADEARDAVEQVDRARERAIRERGHGWCYAADELYLCATWPVPAAAYYEGAELTENGVGAVRTFLDGFERGIAGVPRLEGARITVLTGESMGPILAGLAPALENATGAAVAVRQVENRFYGRPTTVAGLLAGRDLVDALPDAEEGDLVLVPAEALNQDSLFIDSIPLEALERAAAPARLVTGHEITETLRDL